MPFSLEQLVARRAEGLSWLSALIGILLFAVLSLTLTVLVPARAAHAGLIINALAAVFAAVLAPFLLRTFDAMQRRVTRQGSELRSLHAIDRAISGTLELQTILDVAVKEVTVAADGEFGALWLLDEASSWPRATAQAFCNLSPGMQIALTERLGTGATDLVRRTGVAHRAAGLEETWQTERVAAALKLRSQVIVPVLQGEAVLGIMLVGNRGGTLTPLGGFAGEDQALLADIAATVSVAVQHARLYDESRRRNDILRGLVARTGDAIAASSDAPLLMQILADEAARILPCRRVAVYAYDEGEGKDGNARFVPLASHDAEAARDESDAGSALRESFQAQTLAAALDSLPAAVGGGGRDDGATHYFPNVPAALGLDGRQFPFLNSPGYLFVLRSRDRRGIGLLCLLDAAPHLRTPDAAGFARALAAQASVALENAQLARRTDTLLARTQALQAASARIAAELDVDRVLEGVVGTARRILEADGYALWNQGEDGGWQSRAASGLAGPGGELLSRAFAARAAYVEGDLPPGAVRTRLVLPLLYAGRATGVLTLHYAQARAFAADEVTLAQAFAGQAASALENARLFGALREAHDRQRHIAETLQESLLPAVPARIGTFEIAHKYQAALDESVIGGDFFDLFPLGGDRLAVVMADVSGKGLKAAVQTAMLKYTLRGFAAEHPDAPGEVLVHVNDVLSGPLSSHDGFVTLFYGVLDTRTGTLHYANAGHEAPLVRSAGGVVVALPESDGLALGAIAGVPYGTADTTLAPGDLLLLFTDGLTEARASDRTFLGHEGVAAFLAETRADAGGTVRDVYASVSAFAGDVRRDDVAMLALRHAPEAL
jgi:serine phosphatase RsbU (regulator of sigma subunit)